MRGICAFGVLFLLLNTSDSKKAPGKISPCLHNLPGQKGVISYPGFKTNGRNLKLFTENRNMDGACLLYGRIPHAKDLTIEITPRQKSLIYIGGKKYRTSSWNNFIAMYGATNDIQYTTKHSYNEYLQDLKNGTIRIILPGYEFSFYRIVFSKKSSVFTLKYSEKKSVRCKSLDATVVNVESCTDANKINSKCKVKCTDGLAPSPYLYQNDVNFSKSESVLPNIMTKCKGNGFNPPSWDPDITIADFKPVFDEQIQLHEFSINLPPLPDHPFSPPDIAANNIRTHAAYMPGWPDVPDFDTEISMVYASNIPDPRKCVNLKLVADICFNDASIYDLYLGRISTCNYPVDYLLELFGENQGEGIDPDTLPIPAPKSFTEKLQELDQNEKAAFLFKLSEFDSKCNPQIGIKCSKELTEKLLQQLKRQKRNVKFSKMTTAVKQLWGSYFKYLNEDTCSELYRIILLGVRSVTFNETPIITIFISFSMRKAAKRKVECLGCRNPKPAKCERTKPM
uniref:uncharacterized protein LOC120333396 n=1 Tax=Styela clava TaxID=7725 RepID=UPI0019399FFE|nr:uncharacterized protein LOC120333396 [Styela clava]